jgi:hypothetical protein
MPTVRDRLYSREVSAWQRTAAIGWGVSVLLLALVALTYYTSDVREQYRISQQLGLGTFGIPGVLTASLFAYVILNPVPFALVYGAATMIVDKPYVAGSVVVPILLLLAVCFSAGWWVVIAKVAASWRRRSR